MSQYWKDREAENLKRNKLTEEQYKAEVEKIYNRMQRDIQREIDSFYGRYADKEGISIAEAKKRVSKLDMDDYERKAKQYVKDRDFSDLANDEMRLYNLTMKVNRLEMLKSRIGLELIAGHDDLEKFMEEILKGRTIEELERQAGILGDSVLNAANLDKMVSSIVNASFHNANFSQRIWTNEAVMKTELDKLLKQGLIQGKGARELARSLRTLCGVSQRNAERLMITELARVQIEAQKLSYLENDFEEYEYIAEPTACPICKVLDGKHFKVAKMLPGENAAPMHPYCRCSTAPYSDRKEFNEWLNHLEKGGTAEQWDRLIEESRFERGGNKRIGTNRVDLNYIKSEEFRHKFNRLTNNTAVNDALRNYATAMLVHRNGTDGEDLYIIDSNTGDLIIREISSKEELEVKLDKLKAESIRENHFGETIGIHNHPTNVPPTGSDFAVAGYRGYDFGVVVTHTGRVFKYECGDRPFLSLLLDNKIDKYTQKGYNMTIEDAYKKALNELQKEYGIKWEEL